MKNIFTYLSVISLLIMPLAAGAQALPFVAAQMDAHSLSMAGTDAVQTSSVANSAFTNAAVIPFYEKSADISVDYTLWQPSASKVNAINLAGAYNLNSKFGVAAGLLNYYRITGYRRFRCRRTCRWLWCGRACRRFWSW